LHPCARPGRSGTRSSRSRSTCTGRGKTGFPSTRGSAFTLASAPRFSQLAERSLDISGSAAEWESWTGMPFPEDGDYVVPGALVPVRFEDGVGRYVEPNVWMRHEPR